MRLCAPVYNYKNADEWVARHIEKGYGAALWPLGADASDAEIDACAEAARAHGLVIAEVGAWCNLIDENPEVRANSFDYVKSRFELAEYVGARCCVNLAGSKGKNWSSPDPRNLTPAVYEEIVLTTQKLVDSVKPKRTTYTIESMPFIYPYSIESQQKLLRDVDREGFAVHADLCNMVNSIDIVYDTGKLCRDFYRTFGNQVKSVHAKDILLDDAITVRISETIMGSGLFDQRSQLVECAKLDPDLPIMLEHLRSEEEYDTASERMRRYAEELGLEFIHV